LKKKFSEIKPEIVLNTTALHNVDYCESHPEEAFNINSKVVGVIAGLCNNLGSRLIHISTDFAEAARKDWRDLFSEKWISQANLSQSYPGIIRAWHRHRTGRLLYGLARRNEDCRI
jgi:hypothetical protein